MPGGHVRVHALVAVFVGALDKMHLDHVPEFKGVQKIRRKKKNKVKSGRSPKEAIFETLLLRTETIPNILKTTEKLRRS
jgi:hypothetical protein